PPPRTGYGCTSVQHGRPAAGACCCVPPTVRAHGGADAAPAAGSVSLEPPKTVTVATARTAAINADRECSRSISSRPVATVATTAARNGRIAALFPAVLRLRHQIDTSGSQPVHRLATHLAAAVAYNRASKIDHPQLESRKGRGTAVIKIGSGNTRRRFGL